MPDKKWENCFRQASCGDLLIVFGDLKPGELPLKWAAIKTEDGVEELNASAVELNTCLLVSVQSDRCCDENQFFLPLDRRKEELEGYRKRGCLFRGSGRSHGNFYTVTPSGDGVIWIRNEGKASLRFRTPDGNAYRVCSSRTEVLRPENMLSQIGPTKVLLDMSGSVLDFCISALYVKYGDAPWKQGSLSPQPGTRIDTYAASLFCGDDQLGVAELHSDYFLMRPGLDLLDVDGYGVDQFLIRNKGLNPMPLRLPGGEAADVPSDGRVYALETLFMSEKEAL